MQRKLDSKLIFSIIATGLMSFCGVVIETASNITFPVLMKDFNVDLSTVQWMTTGYLLIAAITMPLSAYLKKNFTSKRLFTVAVSLFLLGAITDACATKFFFLVAGRLIQGAAAGIAIPLMFNIILERAPFNKIGLLMGIGTMITAVAPALGPTFGGLVVSSLGWRYVFILIIPLIAISLILGTIFIKSDTTNLQPTKLGLLGFIEIAVAFSGFIFAFSNLSTVQTQPLNFIGPLIIGATALALFIKHSLNVSNPLVNIRLLKLSKFSQGLGAYFIFQVNVLGLSFILPNYVQLINNSTAMIAGLLVLPGGALGAIFAPLSGHLLDEYGARRPIMTGALLEFIGSGLFCFYASNLSSIKIIIFYLIIMLGTGLSMGNIMTSSLTLLNKEENADGNGLFNMTQQLSGAVGTALVSAIMQFGQQLSSASSLTNKTRTGAQSALIFLLILVIVGVYLLYHATKVNKSVKE